MKFYDQLAKTYDHFINWEARIKREDPFYQHLLQERLGTSILDLGCGTGGFSIHWADMGYNVIGVDSSSGMVKQAQELSNDKDIDIEFQCLQMTDFAARIQQQFDLVVCVGNNLAHLLEADKVKRVFEETIKSLKSSGVAVFHVVNYSRILEIRRRDFPVKSAIAGENEYLFLRFYNFLPELLEFHMVVAAKENGEWTSRSNQIKHFPWSKNQLIHIAKEAGFTDILCYGDYEFNEFNPLESNDLIMVCEVNEEIDDPYELYYEPKR